LPRSRTWWGRTTPRPAWALATYPFSRPRGCWRWRSRRRSAAVAGTLSSETTSVGTRVELEHLVASPVGVRVSVRAELVAIDGRLLRFEIVAVHPDGRVVAHGRINRVVVDRVRFLQRSGAPDR
jgi:hypothetical protein